VFSLQFRKEPRGALFPAAEFQNMDTLERGKNETAR